MIHSTHVKGIIGEMEFTIHLLKKGYTILKPINPNSSYDLVIEKDGLYKRLQIKYLTPRNGRLRVEFDRPRRKKTGLYQERGVDAMGIYDSFNNTFYLIPLEKFMRKSGIWIRIAQAKNNQIKNIHKGSDYSI